MSVIGRAFSALYRTRAFLGRLAHPKPPADERAERLRADGLVVLPGRMQAAWVEARNRANAPYFGLERPADMAWSPDGKELKEVASATAEERRAFYFLHIKNYQRVLDVYADVIPVVEPILRAYFGSWFYVRDVYCYRTQPVPAAQGSYQWHRDNYPPGSMKVMVYLTDVEPEDGPLTVAAGSHAGFEPSLGRVGDRYEDAFVRERFSLKDCVGPRGTVILFNNNAIHRATDPRRGHRDVVNFTVFPSVRRSSAAPAGLDLAAEAGWAKAYTR